MDEGTSNSNREAEPHSDTTQSGASRSVAPDIERNDFRLWLDKKRGSVNWYLSMKRYDGNVRCECNLHVFSGGMRDAAGILTRRVGCRPVGWEKEVLYVSGGWEEERG
jgi:hypothetical protein